MTEEKLYNIAFTMVAIAGVIVVLMDLFVWRP